VPLTLPPDAVIEAIHAPVTNVTRRLAFFESDEVTPWQPEGTGVNPALIEGNVAVDVGRDERRTLDITFHNTGRLYRPGPTNGLWYDKVVKVYRGVQGPGINWERQLGVFYIDNISEGHFPSTIKLVARDKTKKLKNSQFPFSTLFPENHPIEEVVRAIAVAGGIPSEQMNLPLTGESLSYEYVFDSGSERWGAIAKVCQSYGYEAFFTSEGILTMQRYADPFLMLPQYEFKTGVNGNMAEYSKGLSDAFLRNHVVVIGENANQVPVFAEAKNTNPSSPTRIARIGQRTEKYDSAFIETYEQALDVAQRFLKVKALEQYELDIQSIVVPYMEVGEVVSFIDPNPSQGDPTNYLLQSFTIPLGLGAMNARAGRVINIEAA
jgi:hypothetical protein